MGSAVRLDTNSMATDPCPHHLGATSLCSPERTQGETVRSPGQAASSITTCVVMVMTPEVVRGARRTMESHWRLMHLMVCQSTPDGDTYCPVLAHSGPCGVGVGLFFSTHGWDRSGVLRWGVASVETVRLSTIKMSPCLMVKSV
jgi:hypothetical protein